MLTQHFMEIVFRVGPMEVNGPLGIAIDPSLFPWSRPELGQGGDLSMDGKSSQSH